MSDASDPMLGHISDALGGLVACDAGGEAEADDGERVRPYCGDIRLSVHVEVDRLGVGRRCDEHQDRQQRIGQ